MSVANPVDNIQKDAQTRCCMFQSRYKYVCLGCSDVSEAHLTSDSIGATTREINL